MSVKSSGFSPIIVLNETTSTMIFNIVSLKDHQSWLIGGERFTTRWAVGEIVLIILSSSIGQELTQEPMCK